jgi:hypothetical protein
LAGCGSGWLWLRTKIVTARYFGERELVMASAMRRKVEAGADSLMALPVEAF